MHYGETWVLEKGAFYNGIQEDGEIGSDAEIEHLFTGQVFDKESKLYYYNARYYDATVGMFITPDPMMSGLNHYAYASCNPVMYSDPTGLEDDDEESEVVNAVNKAPYETTRGKSSKKKDDGKTEKGKETEKKDFPLDKVPKQDKKDDKQPTQKDPGKHEGKDIPTITTSKTSNDDDDDNISFENGGGDKSKALNNPLIIQPEVTPVDPKVVPPIAPIISPFLGVMLVTILGVILNDHHACIQPDYNYNPNNPEHDENNRFTVRIQVQGEGLEESEVIDKIRPVKSEEVKIALHNLSVSISRSDYKKRSGAFKQARNWVYKVAQAGGIDAVYKRSFYNSKEVLFDAPRVDIEILRGKGNIR